MKQNPSYTASQPETIKSLFSDIANKYDLGNAIFSFQMHKFWNRRLIEEVFQKNKNLSFLDLCCGTGDIAFTYLKKTQDKQRAYLIDFCKEMLCVAKNKAKRFKLNFHDIIYLQGNALSIPLENESVDCTTIAYGIRNIQNPQKCINEIFRVLHPSGTIGILELTRPKNSFLRLFHKVYLKYTLPIMGKLLSSNKEAYHYLSHSIYEFSSPKKLKQMLLNSGFQAIRERSLCGGIATILVAKKP